MALSRGSVPGGGTTRPGSRLGGPEGPATTADPRVVVVGAGFGGLSAVRKLARHRFSVTLLDRRNYHLFTPLLYQVASALLGPSEIAQPVRTLVRRYRRVSFRQACLEGVDLGQRLALTDHGKVPYDYLVLATGSVTNYFGDDGLRERTYGLKELDQALRLRNWVLGRFEESQWTFDEASRRRLLTFVVVGGGPTGVEYAGALTELVQLVIRKDGSGLTAADIRVVLVEGGDRLLASFSPSLSQAAETALRRKGVEIWKRALVKGSDGTTLTLVDGRSLPAGTVVWAAGVRAPQLAGALGDPGPGGCLRVGPSLQLPGHPEVLVVGDLASFEQDGRTLPMLAPVAIQEAEHAAASIVAMARGESPTSFHYRDRGIMATVGRNFGVVEAGPLRLWGRPGWWAWLVFHLLQIVSLRSRLVVLINWVWDYLFRDRPVRLILQAQPEPTSTGSPVDEKPS